MEAPLWESFPLVEAPMWESSPLVEAPPLESSSLVGGRLSGRCFCGY